VVFVVAVTLGCAAEVALSPVTVTDSAGIRITLSQDVGATYAVVQPEPVVSLGGPNAEGPTQFYQVDRVILNRDELWVADGQSGELRVFNAEGSWLRTLGGRGDGPGEFLRIRLLGAFVGDSVAVWDQSSGRLTVYDALGTSERTVRLSAGDRALPRPWHVYPDGSVLGQVPEIRMAGAMAEGEIIPASVRLVRFDLDRGTQDDVAAAEGRLWLWTGRDQIPVPFTDNAVFALREGAVHLAAGPAFRLRVFEDGSVTRMYGVDREERAVTAAAREDYRDFIEEFYPQEQHAAYLSVLEHAATPSLLPAYTSVLAAADGTVWAGRYQPDTLWDVYGEEGELLGQVEMPGDFYPMSIRDGRVAGVWRDVLGVEHVRVYGLDR